VIVTLDDAGAVLLEQESAMNNGLFAPLTENEEVTLRRVAYGQSAVWTLRRPDLAKYASSRTARTGRA
jgi:hypothetical protein